MERDFERELRRFEEVWRRVEREEHGRPGMRPPPPPGMGRPPFPPPPPPGMGPPPPPPGPWSMATRFHPQGCCRRHRR